MLGFELKAREAKLAREQAARKEEARRKLEAEQRQEERCVRRRRVACACMAPQSPFRALLSVL
jgi:hypothetical protein